MGLARAAGTDEQDVGLLHDHIPEIGVGDDGVGGVFVPGIDESLEMVGDAKGEASLGDLLTDDELIEVGDYGLGRWDRGGESLAGWSYGGGVGSGTGWGVISARALVAQKAQMRVVESKPPSKSETLELKQKSQQTG
jgi:hypothetical protein